MMPSEEEITRSFGFLRGFLGRAPHPTTLGDAVGVVLDALVEARVDLKDARERLEVVCAAYDQVTTVRNLLEPTCLEDEQEFARLQAAVSAARLAPSDL